VDGANYRDGEGSRALTGPDRVEAAAAPRRGRQRVAGDLVEEGQGRPSAAFNFSDKLDQGDGRTWGRGRGLCAGGGVQDGMAGSPQPYGTFSRKSALLADFTQRELC
jgi:hypothetical protein